MTSKRIKLIVFIGLLFIGIGLLLYGFKDDVPQIRLEGAEL